MQTGELTDEDWARLGRSMQCLEKADLHIFEGASLTATQMKAHCRRFQQRGGLDIIAIPVVLLPQLNRGPEQRTDHKPVVSDLRESGSIEQDADMVIKLHRENAYEKESPRAGEADLIIGKNRNGPTATITVALQGHYSRFVGMNRT